MKICVINVTENWSTKTNSYKSKLYCCIVLKNQTDSHYINVKILQLIHSYFTNSRWMNLSSDQANIEVS